MNLQDKIWQILETVMDPEVPVLSVIDLGIVREIIINDKENIEIKITPTYSGCPATDVIKMSIRMAMIENGITNFTITEILSPAWTTEWMTESGKQKLKEYGIAPPHYNKTNTDTLFTDEDETVQCPRCNSYNTSLVSGFGSTACKALYKCNDCKEPFDYFKCH